MEPRQKWIAAIGLGAIAGAAIISYGMPVIKANAKTHNEIISPANRLQALRDQTVEELFNFEIAESDVLDGDDPLEMFGQLASTDPALFMGENLKTASLNAAQDPDFWQCVATNEDHPNPMVITTKDVLYDHPCRSSRAIARAMVECAEKQAQSGDIDGMIESLTQATRLSESLIRFYEGPAFITHFATQKDASLLIFNQLSSPHITPKDIAKIDKFLREEDFSGNVVDNFTRNVQELIVTARTLEEYDQWDLRDLNAEQRNITPPSDHPQAKEAMEARLIEAWLLAKEVAKQEPDNENAGIQMDVALEEVMDDSSAGNYLVRTIGLVYEQIGRNLMRGSQARQVLRGYAYVRNHQITHGTVPDTIPQELLQAKRDRDNVTIHYTVNGSSFQIRANSPTMEVATFHGHRFEINQLGGVVLTMPVSE